MLKMNEFIEANIPAMKAFLDQVSVSIFAFPYMDFLIVRNEILANARFQHK
jgi:hypothetical protein